MSDLQGATQALEKPDQSNTTTLQEVRWAASRLLFHAYIGFSLFTVVGGFLTAPVMSWYFFGDWRFWRHWGPCYKLWFHGYRMIYYILSSNNGGFMLDVPLTSPPLQSPDLNKVGLNATWEHGNSCDTCNRCCEKIHCPALDTKSGLCLGYNSFFWRYFNCGRYPSHQLELDYYGCPKWELKGDWVGRDSEVA